MGTFKKFKTKACHWCRTEWRYKRTGTVNEKRDGRRCRKFYQEWQMQFTAAEHIGEAGLFAVKTNFFKMIKLTM